MSDQIISQVGDVQIVTCSSFTTVKRVGFSRAHCIVGYSILLYSVLHLLGMFGSKVARQYDNDMIRIIQPILTKKIQYTLKKNTLKMT